MPQAKGLRRGGRPVFEAALVAWIVALLGDGAIKGLRKGLLGSPEQRALANALRLALTVTLSSVPESSRDSVVSALRDRFAEPPVYVLDGRTRVRTGLVKAIHEQLRPLSDRSMTPSRKSYFEETNVDAAQLRDELAEIIIRSIEQVGPAFPALTPLVTQLNADAIIERVDQMAEMIGAAQRESGSGTISRVNNTASVRRSSVGPDDSVSDWVERLTDTLLDIPAVADDDSRQAIFEMLPDRLRHNLPRSRYPRVQVVRMIRTSANFSGGLTALMRAIRIVEGDSLPMEHLDNLILNLADEHSDQAPLGSWSRENA